MSTATTTRNKNLIFIIAVLLLTNIAVLVYFLWPTKSHSKLSHGKGNGMTEMLQNEVGFNDQQVAQYLQLRDRQRQTIRPMFDEMRKAKDSLFRLMGNTTVSDSTINRAADAIAQKQRALDLQTFNHFKQVRSLCVSPEQQVKYDSAVLKMFRKMGKPARRGDASKEKSEKKTPVNK